MGGRTDDVFSAPSRIAPKLKSTQSLIAFQAALPHALPDAPVGHRPQPDEDQGLPAVQLVQGLHPAGGRGGLQHGKSNRVPPPPPLLNDNAARVKGEDGGSAAQEERLGATRKVGCQTS